MDHQQLKNQLFNGTEKGILVVFDEVKEKKTMVVIRISLFQRWN